MEYLELYDADGNVTGEKIDRLRKHDVPTGRYFRIVIIFIQNKKGEFLIQRVSNEKGNEYATTGGHVQFGTPSLETVEQEVLEELGLAINKNDVILFETERYPLAFQDCYYIQDDIDINKLKLQESEVSFIQWMSIEEINKQIDLGLFRRGNIGPFRDLVNILSHREKFDLPFYKIIDTVKSEK